MIVPWLLLWQFHFCPVVFTSSQSRGWQAHLVFYAPSKAGLPTCHIYIIVHHSDTLGHRLNKKPNFQRTFCRHLLAFAVRLGRRVFFFLHLIIPEQSNGSRNSIRDKHLARFWVAGERFFSPRFLPCQMPAGEAYSRFSGVHLKLIFYISWNYFIDVSRWYQRVYDPAGQPPVALTPCGVRT